MNTRGCERDGYVKMGGGGWRRIVANSFVPIRIILDVRTPESQNEPVTLAGSLDAHVPIVTDSPQTSKVLPNHHTHKNPLR
jgi:hypothetical protein